MTTLKDLKRVAKNIGLKGVSNMKKDDLEVAIVKHMQQTGMIVNPYAVAPPMKKVSRKRRSVKKKVSKRKASRKRSRKRRSTKRCPSGCVKRR